MKQKKKLQILAVTVGLAASQVGGSARAAYFQPVDVFDKEKSQGIVEPRLNSMLTELRENALRNARLDHYRIEKKSPYPGIVSRFRKEADNKFWVFGSPVIDLTGVSHAVNEKSGRPCGQLSDLIQEIGIGNHA